MKSRFKIPPDNPPSPARPVGFVPTPIHGEAVARPQVVTYLNSHTLAAKQITVTKLMKRLGPGRHAQGFVNTFPIRKTDPYLLLLLADQELHAGREEQARYLVEAAYEAFDQKTESNLHRMRPIG